MNRFLTLPNALTILRVILTPIFLYFFFGEGWIHKGIALLVFVAAALTDLFDGILARKHKTVSKLGRFMDPLADKILVGAALISFVVLGLVNIWIVVVILIREIYIASIRLYALAKGQQLETAYHAKIKTTFQLTAMITVMFMITVKTALLHFGFDYWFVGKFDIIILSNFLLFIAMVYTIFSGWRYIMSMKHH